jgi:hypothetical protein
LWDNSANKDDRGTEVAVTPISMAGREGTTRPHSAEEQKQNQKQCHYRRLHCLRHDDDAASQSSLRRWQCKSLCVALLLLSSGCVCFCLQEAQSTTNHAQGGGGSYVMVDTCFFVLPKTKTRKKLERLPPILHPLSFFIVSQNTTS